METKKLVAKIQKISPTLPDQAAVFSAPFVVNPDTSEIMLKKGTLYIVLSMRFSEEQDVNLNVKVIQDTLHNLYYQSDSISPIQSLEKAISETKNLIQKQVTSGHNQLSCDLDIAAGALWGNVLYIVQYGNCRSFIIREGSIKQINSASEGKFSAASGIVKSDDAIILCTREFVDYLPIEKLLNEGLPEGSPPPAASCMILKISQVTAPTEKETINFEGDNNKKQEKFSPRFPSLPKPSIDLKPILQSLSQKLRRRANAEAISVADRKNRAELAKKTLPAAGVVVSLMLLISIGVNIIKGRSNSRTAPIDRTDTTDKVTESANETKESTESTQTSDIDISGTPYEVFYDLRIADPNINASSVAVVGGTLAVTDSNSNALYLSSTDTPKFTKETIPFENVANLSLFGSNLFIADKTGYIIYNPTTHQLVSKYSKESAGYSTPYLDFFYELAGDKIIKYTPSNSSLAASTWTQNSNLNHGKALAISISIYVLNTDGTVDKYTRGEQDTFSLTGLETPIAEPVDIVTTTDLENIYIADRGNKRVVILDKTGKFVKELSGGTQNPWSDIRDVTVTQDERNLYLLNDSKILKIALDSNLDGN